MTIHQAGYEFNFGFKDAWDVAERSFIGYALRAGMIAQKFLTVYEPVTQGAAYVEDLFKITGAVEILSLWAIWFYAGEVDNVTKVWHDVYDQTNSVPITANGVDCSDIEYWSHIGRNDQAPVVAELLDADQVRIVDGGLGATLHAPFVVNAKHGVENVIRIHFTNDGSLLYFIMYYNCVWRSLSRGSGTVLGDWF